MSAASSGSGMQLTLHVWRQEGPDRPGDFEVHRLANVSPDMSFLEMLDVLNEKLVTEGREPVAGATNRRFPSRGAAR